LTEFVSGALAIVGSSLVLLAGLGVVRFPDLYSRMHAATKATTLGIVIVAIGAAVSLDSGRAKLLLATAVIFITAPIASHVVGRAAYRAEGIEVRLDAGDDLADHVDVPDHPVHDDGGPTA
jgi:multicomponent Na+:H+ antiporter subunit G